MTKSSKRKAARQADFQVSQSSYSLPSPHPTKHILPLPLAQKQKLKLGKGKQVASNATDTSFKAKTVALPHQSINLDRSKSYTTRKGQTLNDLSIQTRHHNGGVRKEALLGMQELLQRYPGPVGGNPQTIGIVVGSMLHLVGDEDASVRASLLAFLQFLIGFFERRSSVDGDEADASETRRATRSSQDDLLLPFLDPLLLYTTSALSHIFLPVRIDAIKFLHVLLAYAASTPPAAERLVAQWKRITPRSHARGAAGSASAGLQIAEEEAGHPGRILQCLLGMLGISVAGAAPGTSSTANATANTNNLDLPASARLAIYQALEKLLRIVIDSDSDAESRGEKGSGGGGGALPDCPTWIFESSFSAPADWEAFVRLLRPDLSRSSRTGAPTQLVPGAAAADAAGWTGGRVDEESGWQGLMDPASVQAAWQPSQMQQMIARAAALSADISSSCSPAARAGAPSSTASSSTTLTALWQILSPSILHTFLDCAPDLTAQMQQAMLLPPGAAPLSLSVPSQIVCALLSLALLLARNEPALLQRSTAEGDAPKMLSSLLAQVAKHFPFGGTDTLLQSAALDAKSLRRLLNLDLAYCELCARQRQQSTKRSEEKADAALTHVRTYVLSLLQQSQRSGGISNAIVPVATSRQTPLGSATSAETWSALLPTIWLLLSQPQDTPAERQATSDLLDAVLRAYLSTKARDPAKPILFAFLARLCILPSFRSYSGTFRPGDHEEALRTFFLDAPKYLWETAAAVPTPKLSGPRAPTTQPTTASSITAYLRHVVLDGASLSYLSDETIEKFEAMLQPFFKKHGTSRMADRVELTALLEALA